MKNFLVCGGLAAMCWWASLAHAARQNLAPANFSARQDAAGFNWDVEQRGMVTDGTNDCFDGGTYMTVNGAEFMSQQTMMTADGRELVLTATQGSLEVTRRIRISDTVGGARFVESFRNTTNSSQTLAVNIRSHFGGQCQTVIAESGLPGAATLGAGDGALLGFQPPGYRPSVLFVVADPKSKIKPTATVNQNYIFDFNFSLTVPAGRTVSIMHSVVQMTLPAAPDAKALAALIKTYRARQWLSDLPADVRRTIVNTGRGSLTGGGNAPELLAGVERLGIERDQHDVLASGEETRLRGQLSGGKLTIETRFGQAEIRLEDVAAIVGGKGAGREQEVYLRDGQVLRGAISVEKLRFTMNSGLGMNLAVATVDRLATAASPQDGKPGGNVAALLETNDGDCIALVRGGAAGIPALTPWGPREVSLDELEWLRGAGEDQLGHMVGLLDGSRFFAFLSGDAITVETQLFGSLPLDPAEIRSIQSIQAAADEENAGEDAEKSQPHVVLAGGNMLVGRIDLDALHFISSGALIPAPPDQIRLLHNTSEEGDALSAGAVFSAEIWEGGVLHGSLQETVLPFRMADRVWQIPVRDIVDVVVPAPTVPEALRDRIAELIRELGHDEWESREAATQELAQLGLLAAAQLTEARDQAADPEVRRRLKALLEGIGE